VHRAVFFGFLTSLHLCCRKSTRDVRCHSDAEGVCSRLPASASDQPGCRHR